ncbi:unnamed protein product [Rotaria socialis]
MVEKHKNDRTDCRMISKTLCSCYMCLIRTNFFPLFIPVSTTCYDDPTTDYSGRVASKVVHDNQTHVKETSLKFCDEYDRI